MLNIAVMLWLLIAQAVCSGQGDDAPGPGKKRLPYSISRETTHATGPLRNDGSVDYIRTINEQMKQGVTPENNAMVPIAKALGPLLGWRGAPGATLRNKNYFADLGIEMPPVDGKYFLNLENYLQEQKKPYDSDKDFEHCHRLATMPWSVEQYPDEAAWLRYNEPFLKLIVESSQRPRLYSPTWTSERTLMSMDSGTDNVRYLSSALLARAMHSTQQKKFAEAKADILANLRLSRLMSTRPTIIELLMALSIESRSLQAAHAWIAQPEVSAELIISYRNELNKLTPMSALHEKMYFERLVLLDSITLVAEHGLTFMERLAGGMMVGGKDVGLGTKIADALLMKDLNWDPALKQANIWYNRIEAALKNTDRTERQKAINEIEQELIALRQQLAQDFPKRLTASKEERVLACYDVLRCLFTTANFKVQIAVEKVEQEQRLHQVAIALALYQRDKQTYPQQLSQLSPKFLAVLPNDLFSGKPPHYQRTNKGYRLYSVGPNSIDDGGKKDDGYPPKQDDLLVEMPLSVRK